MHRFLHFFFSFALLATLAQAEPGHDKAMLEAARKYITASRQSPPDGNGLMAVPYCVWGDYEEASRVILAQRVRNTWGYWNIYEMMVCWMRFRDKLSPAARERIELAFTLQMKHHLKKSLKMSPTMGNVNHPLSNIMTAILGGEQFGNAAMAAKGYEGFKSFVDHWEVAGSYIEFNSPTYQAVDMQALAMLHEFSTSPEISRMAKILEERLWIETGARYHKPTWSMGGPYARSYPWDDVGAATDVQYYYRRVLGDQVPLLFDVTKSMYRMDHRLTWLGRSAVLNYSCPPYIRDRMLQPPGVLSYVSSSFPNIYPDRVFFLTTVLKGNYTVGTTSDMCANPSRQDFVARWLKRDTADKLINTRTMLVSRGVKADPYTDKPVPYLNQDEGHVLAVYGLSRRLLNKPVSEMAVQAEFSYDDAFEEIRLGNKIIKPPLANATGGGVYAFKDGNVYVALLPLKIAGSASEPAVSITGAPDGDPLALNFLTVKMTAYRGAEKLFTEKERATAYMGFCIRFVNAEEYKSFDAFTAEAAKWTQRSVIDANNNVTVTWDTGSKKMSTTFNIRKGRILSRAVNTLKKTKDFLVDGTLTRMQADGNVSFNKCVMKTTNKVPALIHADAGLKAFVGMSPSARKTPVRFESPLGTVTVEGMYCGKVEMLGGDPIIINVEGGRLWGGLSYTARSKARVYVNGLPTGAPAVSGSIPALEDVVYHLLRKDE